MYNESSQPEEDKQDAQGLRVWQACCAMSTVVLGVVVRLPLRQPLHHLN
jgi:hypothetical protein